MSYEKLHKDSIRSWMISRTIVSICILVPMLISRFILFKEEFINNTSKFLSFLELAIVFIFIFMLLNIFVYPFFEYKQWKYLITKDKIEFSEGIFFIKKVTIPIIRVQHIQVTQGIINRMFKLSNIVISTAGGIHKIPNIKLDRADEISEYLKDKIKEKVEENV